MPPVTKAKSRIARTFRARDWVALTPAFFRIMSFADGRVDLAQAWINQDLREERLRAALVAPDGITIKMRPGASDWQQRAVRAPLNPAEGVRVESKSCEEGRWFIRRADLDKEYPTNPATPAAAAAAAESEAAEAPQEKYPGGTPPAPAPARDASKPVANTKAPAAKSEAASSPPVDATTTKPAQQILRTRTEQGQWLKTTLAANPPGKDEPLTPEGYGTRIAEMGAPLGAMYKPSSIITRYYQLNPRAPRRRNQRK
jgi:hypothetical protein